MMRVSTENYTSRGSHGLVALGFLAGMCCAAATRADSISPLELIGQRPKPYVQPEGYYRVVIPSGFDCKSERMHLECSGNRGDKAFLSIDVRKVPKSATANLVMLNQMERFKKKRHFRLVANEQTKVSDTTAVMATFTYDYLGNVEYPVGVKALYLVKKNKLFVIHFESKLQYFGKYQKDMATIYESFYPAKLDAAGNPIIEDLRLSEDERKPGHIKNPVPIGY
jgi:hypothetical protein